MFFENFEDCVCGCWCFCCGEELVEDFGVGVECVVVEVFDVKV